MEKRSDPVVVDTLIFDLDGAWTLLSSQNVLTDRVP
jgi:hypothetical protein